MQYSSIVLGVKHFTSTKVSCNPHQLVWSCTLLDICVGEQQQSAQRTLPSLCAA
jgi:hypothetical protein